MTKVALFIKDGKIKKQTISLLKENAVECCFFHSIKKFYKAIKSGYDCSFFYEKNNFKVFDGFGEQVDCNVVIFLLFEYLKSEQKHFQGEQKHFKSKKNHLKSEQNHLKREIKPFKIITTSTVNGAVVQKMIKEGIDVNCSLMKNSLLKSLKVKENEIVIFDNGLIYNENMEKTVQQTILKLAFILPKENAQKEICCNSFKKIVKNVNCKRVFGNSNFIDCVCYEKNKLGKTGKIIIFECEKNSICTYVECYKSPDSQRICTDIVHLINSFNIR